MRLLISALKYLILACVFDAAVFIIGHIKPSSAIAVCFGRRLETIGEKLRRIENLVISGI